MLEFDWTTAPLSGKSLIEASAGTGKTFTISRIYLRLILERKLPVQEILVVTFTEAATNELKERIHKTLIQARDGFLGQTVEDELLKKYIQKYKTPVGARELLTIALQDFDEAAVFTIHKFCNRVLLENAFESGGVFDTELVTEQTGLLSEAVEDFWRQKIYSQSGMFLSYALSKVSPDRFYKLIERNVGRLSYKILPDNPPTESDTNQLEQEFSESFRAIKTAWLENRETIIQSLEKHGGLYKTSFKPWQIQDLFKSLDIYTSNNEAEPVLFDAFRKLTTAYLEKNTKKDFDPPSHPFFQICDRHYELQQELSGVFDARLVALKKDLFEFVRAELKRKKEERNVFFFDDLLLNLHAALAEDNRSLAESVRSKFKAALIDEFQDTDPIQYHIFNKVFDHRDATLFLIGDPKQAIYGFRGADIFAYMKAKSTVDENSGFTLSTNYRSEPGLIHAFNHIFGATEDAFIYPEIPFKEAVAAEIPDRPVLRGLGENISPLQLLFYDPSENAEAEQKNKKDASKGLITDRVGDEIVRLLELGKNNEAKIGEEAIEEKDIAVLVRSNAESRQMQEALRRRNVHSVLYTTDNLFASHEALELEHVLLAIASPKSIYRLKAALATEMFGLNANRILQLDEDDDALEDWLNRFIEYYQSWQNFGFIRMMNDLLKNEGILLRLMDFEDGERRITNLLHLAEILNENAIKDQLGINGLIKWLAEQRNLIDKSVEEHQIRLESDENAVKLITMHMSKGLQYPIVFCPFAWGASTVFRNAETMEFHNENDDLNFTLDLGSPEPGWTKHKMMAEKELLAENLRLLYVAITRARNRCYLVWGDLPSAKTSALAYLLHKPAPFNDSQPVETLRNHLRSTKTEGFLHRSETLVAQSNSSIALQKLVLSETKKLSTGIEFQGKLQNKQFSVSVDTKQRISSYSGLVSKHPHSTELADYDAIEIAIKTEPVEMAPGGAEFNNFMSFPRGSKAGTFLHDLLQRLDFTNVQNDWTSELVFEKLREFGFDTQWQRVILNMIEHLMKVNLKTSSDQFKLADISATQCMQELEFYFPVEMLSLQRLQAVYAKHQSNKEFAEKLNQIHFSEFGGFMKGFIDLIFEKNGRFYIADWKSNYLGAAFKSYGENSLAHEMADRLYILQYHLYTIALNNYLKSRLQDYDYEKNFGGVFYVFLRGIEPEKAPGCGIYFDRPEAGFINELSKTIMGKKNG